MNTLPRTIRALALATVASLSTVVTTQAIQYTGSISSPPGNMVTGGNWAGDAGTLSWIVNDTANPGFWTYTYTFTMAGSPGISHAIVEVTDGASLTEFTVTGSLETELGTFSTGPSNPGIPGPIFGIKVGTGEEPSTWTFVTARNPVWQDFYAKGGNDSFAYNSGFLAADPVAGPSDGSLEGHILGPNGSTQVPDGGTSVILMGLALAGIGGVRRILRN